MAILDSAVSSSADGQDRRRALERKAEQDLESLQLLQSILLKSNTLTDRVVGMLDSFDERLVKLEGSVLPIHRSTQKLTRVYDNLDRSSGVVNKIILYMDLAPQEDLIISKPATQSTLDEYLASIERMKEASTYLERVNYRATERAVVQLNEVIRKAMRQLDGLFKRTLALCSVPVDPTLYADGEIPGIPNEDLNTLSTLSKYLNTAESELGSGVTDHIKIYMDIRSAYMIKSLHGLNEAARAQDLRKMVVYRKNGFAFLTYTTCFFKMLKTEREAVVRLIPRSQASHVISGVVTAAVDAFIETGEAIVGRGKRNILKRDFGDVYHLLDVVEGLGAAIHEYEGVVKYAGAKGNDILELMSACKGACQHFFKEFVDEFKIDKVKEQTLSPDGTVHELTSNTLTTLRRLIDNSETVESLLNPNVTPGLGRTEATIKYFNEVLDALSQKLEAKSKAYKKPMLSVVFLLNNYHYISKVLRQSPVGGFLGRDVEIKFDTLLSRQKELYINGWRPALECLMDTTMIIGGKIDKALSDPQRKIIKEKFRTFNETFEDLYKAQKSYAIPDTDLRAQIVKEVRQIIVPLYDRFYERYSQTGFSKNTSKYIKFDRQALDEALDKFFDATA
ncbi:hypothetical protein SeMB42_g07417 [Synchytrium endobioticum]|uniref:Exocyst complex protein EXO70 n=1 Tax=Synchytrium endobioticum TaxID=286115 RepID=A0A507C795_9FUNG|nr:hypothetical protein SeMB42_g07417 [Synchytrium endobioticum]TPX40880.1 hypothetical protein SeLEV6574_g06362 [Synchytrium endobioticum]